MAHDAVVVLGLAGSDPGCVTDDSTASERIALKNGRHIVVRPATREDAPDVRDLDLALAEQGAGMVISVEQVAPVEDTARRIDAMYRDWSASVATMIAVAESSEHPRAIVGVAELKPYFPERIAHVATLSVGVDASARGQGVGRALCQYLLDYARAWGLVRIELFVRQDNPRAIALYRSLGFEHEATRARFVRLEDGRYVDDLIFVRFLA